MFEIGYTGYTRHFSARFNNTFETRFPVGEQIQIDYQGKKYRSFIRGVQFLKYLIMDFPVASGGKIPLNYTSPLSVRFLKNGTVYQVKVNLIRVHPEMDLIVTDYPEAIEGFNLRKSRRIKTMIPAEYTHAEDTLLSGAAVMDMSENGMLLLCDGARDIKKDDMLVLHASLPHMAEKIQLAGAVKNIRPSAPNRVYCGISMDTANGSWPQFQEFYNHCQAYYYESNEGSGEDAGDMIRVGQDISIELKGKKMKTTLRGWKLEKGGYLLVEPPLNKEMHFDIRPGQRVMMSFHKGGSVCGVVGCFVDVLKRTNLWKFEIADELVEHSMREERRYECLIPATFTKHTRRGLTEIGNGMVLDMSMSGVKLSSTKQLFLEKHDTVYLTFGVGNGNVIEGILLEIVRVKLVNDKFIFCGRFLEAKKRDMKLLAEFLDFCCGWEMAEAGLKSCAI